MPENPVNVIKKALLVASSLILGLVAVAVVLYVNNRPPAVPALSTVEAANSGKPYVVKIHAQWCPVCMVTKSVWSQIEGTYATRVNLVVFDFTNQATTDMSRAEAKRLGLEKAFDDNAGWTGTILVLNGSTREETASIHGVRYFAEYRAAIDGILKGELPRNP